MSKQYSDTNMISVEEAIEQILGLTNVLEPEHVPMLEATGRILAQDVASDIDISPFDNSGMDGFAVRASDAESASVETPVLLKIVGGIGAGQVFESALEEGEALRIMTGAPVPPGADTVIKIEDVTVEGESLQKPEGEVLVITKPPKKGKNVRLHGEEVQAGEVLLTAGTLLQAAGVGLLAATGNTQVMVYRRPRVAILSSGDELVAPFENPGPGQIRNSNCYSLAAAVRAAHAVADIVGIVRDDIDEIRETIIKAVAEHDMVLISGGAAEGDFDYTYKVIKELGEVFFTRVNMRPGKAQTLGLIDETIVFGLAGNPSAAMVGFEVLLRPALRRMQGHTHLKRPVTRARLTKNTEKPDHRRFYIRARMEHDITNNEYSVTPGKNQSSALLGALQHANCLVVLPEGLVGSTKDEIVACLRLDIDEGVVI